ncbi:hypothetical protein E2562_006585 [Oryza meyeriana var. granulata]|uniref:Pentacotripeptide-repeat region of PRORP domain-containing protein n=1 Tax=Oryza meyeriana var. granulata TaxID=110450 RepID=A0A6G1EI12_9ORYZ|nr:hypothetical protein E2562_006585 [Oryza meyeriana var. granulata]
MEKAGQEVDVHTYGVLVRALCMEGNMKDARKLFHSMGEKGVKPSNVIYDMMIYGYGRERSSYKALKLIMEMRQKNLVPNSASYGLTIRVLCKDDKCQEAEALLDDMVRAGLQTSESICQALLDAKARLRGSTDVSFV